jgi:hypothetical protein
VGAEGDGQVEPAVADVGDQRRGRVYADVQVQRGVAFGKRGEERFESVARARGQPAPEVAGDGAAGGARGGQRVVGGAQRDARGVEQRATGVGELDVAGGATEQLDAEVGLQAPDRGAQRLLGHVQARRCAREVQLLGDGDEVAQKAQVRFHTWPV